MRHYAKLCLGLLFIAGATLIYNTASSQSPDGPRKGDWDAVQQAINSGLPQTAIEKLEQISTAAINEKAYGEAIRAVGLKAVMSSNIQGNKAEEKIKQLQDAITTAPEEMKPTLQAILANWYWHFYQQNRWRYMQRTQADQSSSSSDMLTWSLPQILKTIDEQFDKAFASSDQLKSAKSADYKMILQNTDHNPTNEESLAYRPTMFDVIAHNALAFYSSGEQASTQMLDSFKVKADSPFLADRETFLQWTPETPDKSSLTVRALELYQELLRFHQNDADKTALLDTDLLRLAFANAQESDNKELKTARYKATLQQFEQSNATHPISTRATAALANIAYQAKDYVEAKKIAEPALTRFPKSVGASMCYNLIQQIEAQSSEIFCDRVWNDPTQKIRVEYRNINKIHFRLVKFDFNAFVNSDRYEPLALNQDQLRAIVRTTAIRAWSADLEPTPDFKPKSTQIDVPAGAAPGPYFLLTSHSGDFELGELDQISIREIWVSKLGLMIRNDQSQPSLSGMVVEAQSGAPIAGATVQQFARDDNSRRIRQSTTTDQEGKFQFPQSQRHHQSMVLVSHQGHSLSSQNAYSYYGNQTPDPARSETTFFTDRTLYRPGQTIHYKGISARIDTDKNRYETFKTGRTVVVLFRDVNGQEIERRSHRTNEFGSFSGTFTAPRDRLTGMMSISVDGEAVGATSISVEEYKRPKFEVTIAAPEVAVQLNQEVKVKGTAKAYTGVPIDGASVTYRVIREVDFPIWYYWRFWWDRGRESVAIANGTATTAADGTFEIPFTAKPDETVDRSSEPKFRYMVHADVTDGTGETRSGQFNLMVGYTSLAASMTADDWLTDDKPTSINVLTTTLNGEGRAAKGSIKIYTLKQPERVIREQNPIYRPYARYGIDDNEESDDSAAPSKEPTSNPNSWPTDRLVAEADFQTDGTGKAEIKTTLEGGIYRAMLETQDDGGNKITAILPLSVLDLDAKNFPIKIANQLAVENISLQPGQSLNAILGSGYPDARFYVVLRHRGQTIRSYWTAAGQTQHRIQINVTEEMRGGFTLATLMVHENRQYLEIRNIDVPWKNKELSVQWERFVSKLQPGQKETWTAIVKGPDAERAASEVVATLYDASLDALKSFQWQDRFRFYRHDYAPFSLSYESHIDQSRVLSRKPIEQRDASLYYPMLLHELTGNFMNYGFPPGAMGGYGGGYALGRGRANARSMRGAQMEGMMMEAEAAAAPMSKGQASANQASVADFAVQFQGGTDQVYQLANGAPAVDLSNVAPRKNLAETAFFYPSLVTGQNGEVRIEFTMPEALTKWKFMAFAHDAQTRSGSLFDSAVSSKDIMVQPNAPRFLREGDEIEFTAKVSNKSATQQTGTVQLSLSDARTNNAIDDQFSLANRQQSFEIPAGETRSFSWRMKVPDAIEFITYKVVGSTGRLSDGEEGYLPILSRRIMLTESISLPIRGAQTKEFEFKKLADANNSDTIKHQSLTVQMVSNPAWYAVMALPYLMEFPHECSEQVFNRIYANALARHIAKSDPKIERIFEQWRGTDALDSPLTKNEELKSVALEESPWYRQAQDESQARRSVGLLFDQNTVQAQITSGLAKLQQTQRETGMWPWFPGGPDNEYITLYIATGFGRMKHLGVNIDTTMALQTLNGLDAWMNRRYQDIKPENRNGNHLSTLIALYLYGRSFFLQEQAIAPENQEAINYWLGQAKKHWLSLNHRQSQAQLAIALKRFSDVQTAKAIMASIKERSVSNEEMGMFWRDTELSWWWYRAPIETQAMMIEAFDEVMNDQESVEAAKVWLIKQKQTQDWKTTKATADAIYALLLRGAGMLASDELVSVELGGKKIEPTKVEAGTGFYEQRFVGPEVQAAQSKIKVTKVDAGVAWGSVHWQYFEDIGKVTPHDQNPLKLAKELYVKTHGPTGAALTKVTGPVKVGDELVVRIILKTDRDMEYIHLKDHRGSGTEPVNVLSQYHYQDGLAYYESTKDTASHFFIDYLPKGTYVFEYSTRVQLRGNYQTGLANIQCMYAPEFNSHSESIALQVE